MSSEKEMTPEEKLLALIQQDKRPDASPAAERPAGVAATPVTAPAIAVQPPPPAAPPAPAAVSSGVAPVPVAKHDAPSPAKAAVPARPDAVGERTPALSSPAPNAAADAGPKLKLAASSAPSLSKSQTGTRSTPASTEESSAVAAHGGRGAAVISATVQQPFQFLHRQTDDGGQIATDTFDDGAGDGVLHGIGACPVHRPRRGDVRPEADVRPVA